MGDKRGFTLLELVVVIAVIGTILAIVTLNFTRLNEKYSVESEIKDLYSNLMRVRDTATKTNTTQFIVVGAAQVQVGQDTTGDNNMDVISDTWRFARFTLNPLVNANFIFDRRGLADVDQIIQITGFSAASAPVMDCIDVRGTRLNMGLMTGANCVSR